MITFDAAVVTISDAAAAIAREARKPKADGEALEKRAEAVRSCALAVSALIHGPQGGAMDYRYDGRNLDLHDLSDKRKAGFDAAP